MLRRDLELKRLRTARILGKETSLEFRHFLLINFTSTVFTEQLS